MTTPTLDPSKKDKTDGEPSDNKKNVENTSQDFVDIDPFTEAIADPSPVQSVPTCTFPRNFDFANFEFLFQSRWDSPNSGKEALSSVIESGEESTKITDDQVLQQKSQKTGTHESGATVPNSDLDVEQAAQNFVPEWGLKNGTLLKTGAVCQDFLYQSVPAAETFANRRLSATEFSDSYTTSLVGALAKGSEMHHRWFHARARKDYYKHRLREVESSFVSMVTEKLSMERELCELREKAKVDPYTELTAKVKSLETELEESKTTQEKAVKSLAQVEHDKTVISAQKNQLVKFLDSQLTPLRLEVKALNRHMEGIETERKWLITEGFRLVFDKVKKSNEFLAFVSKVSRASAHLGFQKGLEAGYVQAAAGAKIEGVPGFDSDAAMHMKIAAQELRAAQHPLITDISDNPNRSIEEFKALLVPSMGEGETSPAPSTP